MKIYVASSWRNALQPEVVRVLRDLGHDVYDFRNPRPGDRGFSWSEIDPNWKEWTPEQYRDALRHPVAARGYASDIDALRACDACVFVRPCGCGASWELGYAQGQGKRAYVLQVERQEPELMFREARFLTSIGELREEFERRADAWCAPFPWCVAGARVSFRERAVARGAHGDLLFEVGEVVDVAPARAGEEARGPSVLVRFPGVGRAEVVRACELEPSREYGEPYVCRDVRCILVGPHLGKGHRGVDGATWEEPEWASFKVESCGARFAGAVCSRPSGHDHGPGADGRHRAADGSWWWGTPEAQAEADALTWAEGCALPVIEASHVATLAEMAREALSRRVGSGWAAQLGELCRKVEKLAARKAQLAHLARLAASGGEPDAAGGDDDGAARRPYAEVPSGSVIRLVDECRVPTEDGLRAMFAALDEARAQREWRAGKEGDEGDAGRERGLGEEEASEEGDER